MVTSLKKFFEKIKTNFAKLSFAYKLLVFLNVLLFFYRVIFVSKYFLLLIPPSILAFHIISHKKFRLLMRVIKRDNNTIKYHLNKDFNFINRYLIISTICAFLTYNVELFLNGGTIRTQILLCVLIVNITVNFFIRSYIILFCNRPVLFPKLQLFTLGMGSITATYWSSWMLKLQSRPDDFPVVHKLLDVYDPVLGRGCFVPTAELQEEIRVLKNAFNNTTLKFHENQFVDSNNNFSSQKFEKFLKENDREAGKLCKQYVERFPSTRNKVPGWLLKEDSTLANKIKKLLVWKKS